MKGYNESIDSGGEPQQPRNVEIHNYGNFQYVERASVLNQGGGVDSEGAAEGQSLMLYIPDAGRRAELVAQLAAVRDLRTLCGTVIWNLYNEELNDLKDKRKIVVSASFIQSIIPLLKNFEGVASLANIRDGIHRIVLDRDICRKSQK